VTRSTFFLLLLLVLLIAGALGCANETKEPDAHAALAAAASTLPRARGCGVTDADIAAVKFGDYPEDTIAAARDEYWKAREENDAVENRLKENLARVGPALAPAKLAAFVDAFERIGTVDKKKVSDVRARYAAATRKLATVLDAVDADENVAYRASNGTLLAAYGELAKSTCPARAVRFAVILLALPSTPNSPYINLQRQEASSHGLALLYEALAGGVVEEAVAAGDPDAGLAVIRGWVGTASGYTGTLATILKNREALNAQVRGGAPLRLESADMTKPLQVVNGVLALWNLSDAAAQGDVLAILQTGSGGVQTMASAIGALGRHFELSRVSSAGDRVAGAAGTVGRYVGLVFEAKAVLDLLATLDEPNTDKQAALVELGGHALILVGAFVPPPLGIVLSFGGSVAIFVSRYLRDPPPDELSPLLQALVDQKLLAANEMAALKKARAENMFLLHEKLALDEDEVLWTVTRSPNVVAQGDAFAYLAVLAPIARKKGKTPIALLKAIAKSSDVAWSRFELETFLTHVRRQPSLFTIDEPKKIKEDLLVIRNERFVADFFDPKYEKRDDGKPLGTAEQLLAHARGAIDGALASIP
jgi:hypothetical protein